MTLAVADALFDVAPDAEDTNIRRQLIRSMQTYQEKAELEAHEYLNALKAGELHESAAFSERFARYKAQYAFPKEN